MLKLIPNIKDEMTPLERANAISNGLDYDRIPIDPFLGEIKARYINKNTREYWNNEDNLVMGEVCAFNKYGYDSLGVGPNAYGIAEAIGIKAFYPEKGLIYIEEHKISSIKEICNLEPISLSSGKLEMYYNATARIRELSDGIIPVGSSLSGPLTLASFVLGTEKLLKAMIRNKEEVHLLLSYITDCMKFVIDSFSRLDIGFSMADPVASITMISPKMYKEFAFPYTQKISKYLNEKYGKRPSYHVCGNTEKVWEDISNLYISAFSIDNEMDINKACEFFSEKKIIAGNIPPVSVICKGSKELIEEEVKKVVSAAKCLKKGFILTPGCNLPLSTPDKNIEYFMDAGRKYGKL